MRPTCLDATRHAVDRSPLPVINAFNATSGEYSYRIPGYTTVDVFAGYAFSETLKARLNVGNVFDRDYYLAAYRSGSFTYIGDARSAQLGFSAEF